MFGLKKMTVLCLMLSWLVGAAAWAQTGPTGGLSGVVTDPSGAAIPAAKILVKNEDTNASRTTESNNSGYWEIRFLPVGKYRV